MTSSWLRGSLTCCATGKSIPYQFFCTFIDADDDSVQDEDSAGESDSDEGNEDRQVRSLCNIKATI